MAGKNWLPILAVACLAFAPLHSANAADPIRIGVPGAHSGDLAGYGMPALNAANLVVDAVNAKGGINGRLLEIVAQDDQCKPELSTNAATKLLTSNVDVIMGHTCSGATKAVLGMYNDKKIVVVSPSATSPELTQERKYPYFFRTTPSDDEQARLGAYFALDTLKAKKIAVLHDKGDYGKGYAQFVKRFIEERKSDAKVVFFDGLTPVGVDYSPIIQKIARSGADTIIFGGYYPEASKLMTIIKSRKMNINFVSEDGVKTEAFLKLAGESGEGVYASCSRDFSDLPLTKAAIAAHEAKYKTGPGQFFMQAYAATQAIVNALEQTGGSADPDALAKALRETDVETPIGKIRFDDKGDTIGAEFVMFKVVNGAFAEESYRLPK